MHDAPPIETNGKAVRRHATERLHPMNRCHAGPDMSAACRMLREYCPGIEVLGYPTGRTVNGWRVPPGWTVERASRQGPDGRVIADLHRHPLHLYPYSPSFTGTMHRAEREARSAPVPHPGTGRIWATIGFGAKAFAHSLAKYK